MYNKIDVLNLESIGYASRDRQMATLVCNYLRYLGYNVIEESIFRGYQAIEKYKPKVLFISNSLGAHYNYQIVKYAKQRNCLVLSLISEGICLPDNKEYLEAFLWGWNTEKILYEDIQLQWSTKTRDLSLKNYPELKNKIKISGGVGFDLYKFSKKISKEFFLNKYNKSLYKKIIGIGCWDFGTCVVEDSRYRVNQRIFTKKELNRFVQDGHNFNKVVIKIIKNNPDILFLLKEHPQNELGLEASGIKDCDKFENVIILKNQESIFDCIAVSDFWCVYESTTQLEAWLIGKQTCLLNPSGTDFKRMDVYKGSPNYDSYERFQEGIDNFYENGELSGFKNLEKERSKVIKDIIQWDDGFNHVRAGNEIIHLLESNPVIKLNRITLKDKLNLFKRELRWLLVPYLKYIPKYQIAYNQKKRFDYKVHSEYQKDRYKEQINFYQKNNLTIEDLKNIKCL